MLRRHRVNAQHASSSADAILFCPSILQQTHPGHKWDILSVKNRVKRLEEALQKCVREKREEEERLRKEEAQRPKVQHAVPLGGYDDDDVKRWERRRARSPSHRPPAHSPRKLLLPAPRIALRRLLLPLLTICCAVVG